MKLLTFITSTFLFLIFWSDLSGQTTPPFIEDQGYLYDASLTGTTDIGLGAQNVWFLPGAFGENVNIVDVEQGWNLNHEDLPPGIQLIHGSNNPSKEDHGTAVLGILVGQDNGFGITGLCPLASIQVSSHYDPYEDDKEIQLKNAIHEAAQALNEGDILIIEAERVLHGEVRVPAENWPLVRTEIVNAVQAGIIVIEAAGNGGRDIAPYVTGNSGAIIVAAGKPGELTAIDASNWGDRVDLHAWGNNVVTTGKGDFYSGNPATTNDDYTNTFGYTSAATALVGGVAASLQGIYYANTGAKLTPDQMRTVLKDSGIPHQNGNENIGPRPNLPAAIDSLNANYGANLPNFFTVRGDQKDAGGASFGNLEHYKLERFFEHPVPYDFSFPENSEQVVRALQDYKPATTQKYNDWEEVDEVTNHHSFAIEPPTPLPMIARFRTAHNATIQTELISANQMNLGYVEFKDPWLWIDGDPQYYDPPYGYRNLGMDDAELEPYDDLPLELFTTNNFKGVFLNQDPAHTPVYYSARVPLYQILNINGEDITWNFADWEGSGAQVTMPDNFINGYFETPVVFQSPNAIVSARYKGHLRTSLPGNGNSKNQRRVLAAPQGNWQEGYWNMVYEDAGDIWLAWSGDDALSWDEFGYPGYPKLMRINFNRGQAANPTLSNIFVFSGNPNDYNRYVIAWTERNTSGEMEIHLQTMKLGYPHYGWGNYSDWDREASHRVINVTPAPNARPVVQLHQQGNNVILTLAFEIAEGGPISLGYIEFEGNGSNVEEDLDEATEYQEQWYWCLIGSLQIGCQYPALLRQEAVYGQNATTFLYCVEPQEDGFSSIIVQFDLSTCDIEYLDQPEDYFTYYSLQGVISQGNAMIGIAAEMPLWGAGIPAMVFYKKYPNDPCPQLNSVITSMDKPTIMAENSGGYASLIGEIMMRSVGGNWYRWPGYGNPLYLGNQAAGIYTRAVVDEDDRAAMVTRINTTPAKLELYSGSGIFNEGGGGIQTDIRLFRSWKGGNNQRIKVLLDFSGADIELPDSLLTGRCLASVRLLNPSPENIIARQPDTLTAPIGVDVVRNGQTVYSFPPRPWTTLKMSSLPGVESGDILKFKLERLPLFRKGYAEISLREENRKKAVVEEKIADMPVPVEFSLDIFPNPFNPVTTFKIALPQPAQVRLEVFNVLGQLVETIVNEYLPAGYQEIRFDGSNLSSGIYIYRFRTSEKVQTGRILLLK